MKKQPPTRRQLLRLIQVPQHRTRLELVLDFDRPVSLLVARETVRKLLDHMEIAVNAFEGPDELGEATLRSGEFKRIVRIGLEPPEPLPEPKDPGG